MALEKAVFGKARVRNLVWGFMFLLLAVFVIVYAYAYASGLAGDEGYVILIPEGLAFITCIILFLGFWAGYEIGRYVEMEFGKRREKSKETCIKMGR